MGCGACVNLCPRLAIRFIDSRSYIDQQSCIECGTCRDACGVDAIYADCRFPDLVLLNFPLEPAGALSKQSATGDSSRGHE